MKSTTRLQDEADVARIGLADTLGQLRDGMAPSALSGEAISLFKDSGLSLVRSFSEQARANPMPALLIGAGLVMLLTKTTGGDVMSATGSALRGAAASGAEAARGAASAAGETVRKGASAAAGVAASAARGTADKVRETADTVVSAADRATTAATRQVDGLRQRVGDKVESAADAVADRYASARDTVQGALDQGRAVARDSEGQARGAAEATRERAMSMAEETRQSVSRLLEEQPILVAALGAALGAAVGAALPLSRAEKDMLGGLGAGAVGAGRQALENAAGVLREEVSRADLGGKASEIVDKIGEAAGKVTNDVSEGDAKP